MKLYKAIFHKYAQQNITKSFLQKMTFDDIQKEKSTMNFVEVFNFMTDFKIWKNFPSARRETIKKIIRMINSEKFESEKGNNDLELAGFIEFVL